MRTSVADYLADFQRLGKEPAYAERVGYRLVRWTYGDVARLAFRFARELASRGIGKGDRVVVWGPNSAAWVAVFLACANRGVIAVPMDDDVRLRPLVRRENQLCLGVSFILGVVIAVSGWT